MSTAARGIQQCFDEIHNWMNSSMLRLNEDKTEFMVFGSKYQLNHLPFAPSLQFADNLFHASDSVRDLGVQLDSNLTMESHITSICKSAYFHLRCLAKIKKTLTPQILTQLVHCFITSRLDYGNSLLYGCSSSILRKLQLIQNSAARLITGTKRREHITPILKNLHWLPVEKRITFKILVLTYRALHNMAPPYLSNLIEKYHPGRTLRSGQSLNLQQPMTRTQYGDLAFTSVSPRLWNDLPHVIKSAHSLTIFKKLLKTHLFNMYYM